MNTGPRVLRRSPIDLARFKAAVEDGLRLADLAARFGLSKEGAFKLRKKVMADVPGWKAKIGVRL